MNKEKALLRERTRFRKRQNPSAIDFRRMRRLRKIRAQYWLMRRKSGGFEASATGTKTKKEKKRKEKEPELEEIREPELETISEADIDELYSIDDDEDVEEETEASSEE